MKSCLFYLACPYTHKSPQIRQSRFRIVSQIAGDLTYQGYSIISPISMNVPMSKYSTKPLPGTWDFWKSFDELLLSKCDILAVVTLDSVPTSVGVQGEIAYAVAHNLPIVTVDPLTCEVSKFLTFAEIEELKHGGK